MVELASICTLGMALGGVPDRTSLTSGRRVANARSTKRTLAEVGCG